MVMHGVCRSREEQNAILTDELAMTTSALKKHPKVYWIWNHRRWCLENVPDGPGEDGEVDANGWKQANWTRELQVVERMLDADARNCEPKFFRLLSRRRAR